MAAPGGREKNRSYTKAINALTVMVRLLAYVLIVVLVIFGGRKVYELGYEAFSTQTVDPWKEVKEVRITISKELSVSDIGNKLKDAGLIDESVAAFVIQAYAYGYARDILPGTYVLNTSMTVEEMLIVMSTAPESE